MLCVGLGEELLHLGPGRSCRKRLVLEEPRTLDGRRETRRTPVLVCGIAEEGPQRLGGCRHGNPTPALPADRQKRIYVAYAHVREGVRLGAEPLAKLVDKPCVLTDGLAGQSPLVAHACGKGLDQDGKRCNNFFGLIESAQESQPLCGDTDETPPGSLAVLRMLPVELRLHPPFSRHGDRCHIERAIGGECKSMGDEAQCLCQVLERSRRETGGGTHGQIALTFFN